MENLKIKQLVLVLFFLIAIESSYSFSKQENVSPQEIVNVIPIQLTDYGLIFTEIQVNGRKVKTLIDLGDQHVLQLSSSLTNELGINTQETDHQVSDLNGNTWKLLAGIAEQVQIGNQLLQEVTFTSQEGEMEAVSAQIGTDFQAVLGWGFFKNFYTQFDYQALKIILFEELIPLENEIVSAPFSKEAGQLLIPVKMNDRDLTFMIDTGAPVSVLETSLLDESDLMEKEVYISHHPFLWRFFAQDLSVLEDLGVVGILGGDFLQQYKLLINPKDESIHFIKYQ